MVPTEGHTASQQRTRGQHRQALSRWLLCSSPLLLPLLLHGLTASRPREGLSLLGAAGALPLGAVLPSTASSGCDTEVDMTLEGWKALVHAGQLHVTVAEPAAHQVRCG